MFKGDVRSKWLTDLRLVSQWDFYLASSISLLTTILHFSGWFVSERAYQSLELEILRSPVTPRLFLLIGIGLAVNVIGLWSRKTIGLLISVVVISFVGICHLLWYLHSQQVLDTFQ